MERRYLLAILLSLVVLTAYQALLVKPKPTQVPSAPAQATQNGTRGSEAASPVSTPAPIAPTPQAAPREATPTLAAPTERDVSIETGDVIAVFTNKGARLKSWRVKHYLDPQKQPQELVVPIPGHPLPFTVRTPDNPVANALNDALFDVSGVPEGRVDSTPADLKFEYRDSAGLAAVKEFHFEPSGYIITVRASVTDGGKPVPTAIVWGPAVGDQGQGSSYAQKAEGLLSVGGKVQRLASKDIAKQNAHEGPFRYVGVDDNYFMTVAMPTKDVKVTYQPVSVPGPNPKDPPHDFMEYSIEPTAPDEPIRFFVGPKDLDVLARVGQDLPKAINFGMFEVIVVPLLRSLKWVNGFVGNYGWSIVVLTIIINMILFPLQHKSIVSMRKMQEIQPQVKAIQDRYAKYKASDPEKQKMNQELMTLYRERGVNPASGCVPMLLTMPLLLAMWAMLQTSIELRGAAFLWLHDLTQRDPYYVTPVLMGATQFWQQKITPAAGADPAQQKMMMVMPLVMTVMFITLPAGALVYYTVSGLLRIGQQYVTNSIIGPPKVRVPRPPAERRVKRVGTGKTDAAADKT
jgi:YidC/Oxa1 family membrane protein insertase